MTVFTLITGNTYTHYCLNVEATYSVRLFSPDLEPKHDNGGPNAVTWFHTLNVFFVLRCVQVCS